MQMQPTTMPARPFFLDFFGALRHSFAERLPRRARLRAEELLHRVSFRENHAAWD